MLVTPSKFVDAIIVTLAFSTTRMIICEKITIAITTIIESTFSSVRYQKNMRTLPPLIRSLNTSMTALTIAIPLGLVSFTSRVLLRLSQVLTFVHSCDLGGYVCSCVAVGFLREIVETNFSQRIGIGVI